MGSLCPGIDSPPGLHRLGRRLLRYIPMPAYLCIFALACLVASTAATACEPFTLNDTTWEDVNSTYCQGVVTWPVVKGEDYKALDEAAFAEYTADRVRWEAFLQDGKADASTGQKTDNNCLAFARRYHCVVQFKRCYDKEVATLCEGYCKERKFRCQLDTDCTKGTTKENCSS